MLPTLRPATRRPTVPSRRRTIALPVLVVTAALALGACASSASSVAGGGQAVPAVGAPDALTAAPLPADAGNGFQVGRTSVAADGSITKSEAYAAGAPIDTKVIKTGSLSMEVDDIDGAVADARTAIVALGGYVAGTSAYDQGTQRYASITYRIPAERWDDALVALRRIGTKVTDEQTGAVEVTAQVVDLDARVRNLKATETQLLEIMTKATRIADILAVQTQLTDVRGQIEQLSAQLKQLEDQAALGTLTVSFTVPVAAVEQAGRDWDLGKQVDGAIAALIGLGQFVVSLAIWLALVGVPTLLALAVIWLIASAVLARLGIALPRFRRRGSAG